MATAGICSTFTIVVSGADLNVAKTFTASRPFTIVGIQANNAAAGAGTLTVTKAVTVGGVTTTTTITATTAAPPVAGAGVVQAQAVTGPVCDVALIAADAFVPAGAVVSITTSATTINKIVLICVGTEQAITIV
jgi:hypothetical protein